MKQNLGIVIRIKPNKGQRELLEKHFGANRWLYNHFLDRRKKQYQETKKGSTYNQDAAALTKLKHDGEHEWLNEISVASLQRTLRHLDTAYKNFFKKRAKFPNFKSKKNDQSFTLSGSVKIKGKRISFVNFKEGIKFNRDLPATDKINNLTVKRTASGKYYAVLSIESNKSVLPKTEKDVGIDLGLKDFAVFSTGYKISHPKFFRRQQANLKRHQQHLSRKKKGSKRREKQRKKVARIHERIANARRDFLHKASMYAVKNFDMIYVEDLAVKNMMRNRCLSKSIADSGWSEFLRMLEYKAKWYGKKLVKADRFYPSSKTCSHCGFIHQGLRLNDRVWTCPQCGEKLDRDLNASVNILQEGKRNLGAMIPENRRRGRVSPKRIVRRGSTRRSA